QQQNQALQAALQEFGAVNPALTGLTNAANLGLGQYNLPQAAVSDLANYLKLGQNASLAGANIGQIGTQNAQAGLAGLDTLLGGGGAAGGLLFGSQGLSGALGLGSSGLLGAGLGALGGGLSAGAAGAASGFGDAFGSGALDLGTLLFA